MPIVSVEGIDSVGKSQLIKALKDVFAAADIRAEEFDELSGSREAEIFRREIFGKRLDRGVKPGAITSLFFQARYHTAQRVKSFLEDTNGEGIALLHRASDTGRVFHVQSGHLPKASFEYNDELARDGISPESTLLLVFPDGSELDFASSFIARRIYISQFKPEHARRENIWDASRLNKQRARQNAFREVIEGSAGARNVAVLNISQPPEELIREALNVCLPFTRRESTGLEDVLSQMIISGEWETLNKMLKAWEWQRMVQEDLRETAVRLGILGASKEGIPGKEIL